MIIFHFCYQQSPVTTEKPELPYEIAYFRHEEFKDWLETGGMKHQVTNMLAYLFLAN